VPAESQAVRAREGAQALLHRADGARRHAVPPRVRVVVDPACVRLVLAVHPPRLLLGGSSAHVSRQRAAVVCDASAEGLDVEQVLLHDPHSPCRK
jgi:hypothetical protein